MPLTLWLADRSRHDTGLGHCKRDRFLQYHAGPNGYGWARTAQSMPAVTGQLVHSPLALVLDYVRRSDALPSDAVIHATIQAAISDYQQTVEKRGLTLTNDPEQLRLKVLEQTTLIEGLVWTWVRGVLPTFHVEHKVVDVETEGVVILGCTCGLGDRVGAAEEHDARGCEGVGWMTREDAIFQHRGTGTYSYHEFKTTGQASKNWEEQWYHRVQLVAGVLGAEQRLGVTIDEVYIHALIKGKHQGEWNAAEGKASGPKYQNSPLVYGWRRPANPPQLPEDWAHSKNYVDDQGKNRRLTNDYARTGVWELPEAWWKQEGVQSPSDYWVRWLAPTGKLADCYRLIGPIYRNDARLQQFTRQFVAEERRWQEILWRLYELEQQGLGWTTPEYQTLLDELVPQSRGDACQNFFGDVCGNLKLCDKVDGWQAPELIGYIPRRPHHAPELTQAVERGLLPPDDGLAEDQEGSEA